MIKRYVMVWDRNCPEPKLEFDSEWPDIRKEHLLCKWEDVLKYVEEREEKAFIAGKTIEYGVTDMFIETREEHLREEFKLWKAEQEKGEDNAK